MKSTKLAAGAPAGPLRKEPPPMKRFRPLLAIMVLVAAQPLAQAGAITAKEAAQHIGEVETVHGVVVSATHAIRAKGQPTFLNLDNPYPNEIFTIVIWGSDRGKFPVAPEVAFKGKPVRVSGTITEYRGTPEIIVRNPTQITDHSGLRLTSSLSALVQTPFWGLLLSLFTLLIAYLALHEQRLNRRQSVKPLLTLSVAPIGLQRYRFVLKNEGSGVAFNIILLLKDCGRPFGSLDFIAAGGQGIADIDLKEKARMGWHTINGIILKYYDIYNTIYTLKFQLTTDSAEGVLLLDPSSVKLREFSERPRYALKTSLKL